MLLRPVRQGRRARAAAPLALRPSPPPPRLFVSADGTPPGVPGSPVPEELASRRVRGPYERPRGDAPTGRAAAAAAEAAVYVPRFRRNRPRDVDAAERRIFFQFLFVIHRLIELSIMECFC